MTKAIPIHSLIEQDETAYKIVRLDPPTVSAFTEAHRHNVIEIFFFENNGGTHMIDFDIHPIKANSIHFVLPGQIHALKRGPKATGYVIVFSKEFMFLNSSDKVITDFPAFKKSVSHVLTATNEVFNEIIELIKVLETEYQNDHRYKDNIMAYYISILLFKCKALFTDAPSSKSTDASSQQLMQRFNSLLEEKFVELHKVNEYADLLNVTPNHLSETIKKLTAKTAGDLIHNRLILEAKRVLLHSSITAKELSYSLNFNDPSYFSRFFKAKTGLSPEEFRKQIRKKYHH